MSGDCSANNKQYLTPASLRSRLAAGKDGSFKSSSQYEAAADFYVKDPSHYVNAFKDPYYLNVVSADENNFVDKGQVETSKGDDKAGNQNSESPGILAMSTMGYTRDIIKDGKAVVEVNDDIWQKWQEWQGQARN